MFEASISHLKNFSQVEGITSSGNEAVTTNRFHIIGPRVIDSAPSDMLHMGAKLYHSPKGASREGMSPASDCLP